MNVTNILVGLTCLAICISQTMGALKLGLGKSLELPILGELNADVSGGINVQKGLFGITKLAVKGLLGKATSALLKGNLPKGKNDNKIGKGNEPRPPLTLGKDTPK